jgi:hypothetical protein
MAIVVTKISEALYTASATPPHVRTMWETTQPLRMHTLWDELLSLGAHQVDIGDAMDQADSDWIRDENS